MEIKAQSSISTIHSLSILANEKGYVDRIMADENNQDAITDYQSFVAGYNPASGRYILRVGDSQKTASVVQNKALGIGQDALYRSIGGGSINWI